MIELILIFFFPLILILCIILTINNQINPTDVKHLVIIDTETSSLNKNSGEVLQLSAIKYNVETNKIEDYFDRYIKPSDFIRIDKKAMEINGILLGDCTYPKKAAFCEFNKFCKDCLIAGYNVGFDIGMINDDMEKEHIKPTYYKIGATDILEMIKKI